MRDPSPENLCRLAEALSTPTTPKKTGSTTFEPHPHVDAIEFRTTGVASYRTSAGMIDVLMELLGVGPYDRVRRNARQYELDGLVTVVAGIDDIITSKETSDRAKDWLAMPALHEARDRLREAPEPFEVDPVALEIEPGSDPDDISS